jgi:hypothetical protein
MEVWIGGKKMFDISVTKALHVDKEELKNATLAAAYQNQKSVQFKGDDVDDFENVLRMMVVLSRSQNRLPNV